MGFWAQYKATMKPMAVEEPIDAYVHRPLGFLFARAAFPTPISPDLVTALSVVAGALSGVVRILQFPHHLQIGALLIVLSAALDCADGQLARMRKTSTPFGRMFDGVADMFASVSAVAGTLVVLWREYSSPHWLQLAFLGVTLVAVGLSSLHTALYDHYKNAYLWLTNSYHEGEDFETAMARYRGLPRGSVGPVAWVTWNLSLFYLKSQRDFLRWYDPYTSARWNRFPTFDAARAKIYEAEASRPMAWWRALYGFGTVMFGLALFNFVGHPELYVAFRLIVLNAIFYLWLRPMQREASRRAFERMGLAIDGMPKPPSTVAPAPAAAVTAP